MKLKSLAIFLFIFSSAIFANAADVDKSQKICSLINDTIILTTPCAVNESAQVISFEISLDARRAGMLCGSIKRIAYANGWRLPTEWKIQVKSQKTGDELLAECAYKPTDLFG